MFARTSLEITSLPITKSFVEVLMSTMEEPGYLVHARNALRKSFAN